MQKKIKHTKKLHKTYNKNYTKVPKKKFQKLHKIKIKTTQKYTKKLHKTHKKSTQNI